MLASEWLARLGVGLLRRPRRAPAPPVRGPIDRVKCLFSVWIEDSLACTETGREPSHAYPRSPAQAVGVRRTESIDLSGGGEPYHFFLAPLPGAVAGRRIDPGFALSAA